MPMFVVCNITAKDFLKEYSPVLHNETTFLALVGRWQS